MTFKHMKFEDSPTMRALEKVAKEKGLVKAESLEKKVAITKKADYKPTPNLMENIFKLCTGLRDSGLKKEADEIEMNYLNLKRAQTLYETSKETGDDLIQSAHPKGSHKLEGVDGDEAVVEDILDQHLKIVEMVSKKPTGKLVSSRDIMKAVKTALGQMNTDQIKEHVFKYIVDRSWAIRNQYAIVGYNLAKQYFDNNDQSKDPNSISDKLWNSDLTDMTKAINELDKVIRKMGSNEPTEQILQQIMSAYDNCINESDIENEERKRSVVAYFTSGKNATGTLLQQLITWRKNPNTLPEGITAPVQETPPISIPEVTIQAGPIAGKGAQIIGTLKGYRTLGVVSKNKAAINWIDAQIREIQDVMNRYSAAEDAGQGNQVLAEFQKELAVKENEVNDFYKKVSGQK